MQDELITVYSTGICPKCQRLKDFLDAEKIPYRNMDMQSANGMSELLFYGVFAMEAPVLKICEKFYLSNQIFQKNELKKDLILSEIEKISYTRGFVHA